MWRPENWSEARTGVFGTVSKHSTHEDYLFEAGATAILEAICNDENAINCIDQFDNEPEQKRKGWLVFIPED